MDAEGNTLTEGYPDELSSDQRGYPYTRFTLEEFRENKNDVFSGGFAATDIGAFETQLQPLGRSEEIVVSTLFDESDGDFRFGDLSLREAIEIANVSSDHNTIRFAICLLPIQIARP